MNQTIKDRIAKINNGQVPEGYEKTSFGIFPCDWEKDELKHLGEFGKGKGIPGNKMTDEGVPCVGYGDIYMKYNYHFEKAQSFVDIETAKESQLIKKGTLLFTGTGETAEEIGKCVCYNGEEDIYAGGDIITFVANKINPLFLSYQQYLDFALKQKASFGQGHSVVHIQKGNLEKLNCAYPKAEQEQSRIAQILMQWDKTIELQEKYIASLENRKKALMQRLLSPKEGWKLYKMNQLGELYQPQTISEKELTKEGYLVYGANGIIGRFSKYNHEDSQIAITCRGSTCGEVILTEPKSWITGNAMVFDVNNILCDKIFMYYLCKTIKIKKVISGSGQPQITREALQYFEISIPNKIMQLKIANILSQSDQEISLQKQKIQKLIAQRKVLMQVLLTGIVRV